MQVLPVDKYWSMEPGAFEQLRAIAESVDISALMSGSMEDAGELLSVVDDVGIIDIRGTITKHPSWFHSVFGGNTSTLAVSRAMDAAVSENSIKSIMLRVDSPGGSVEGVTDLAQQIYDARGSKSIVAQIDGTGASAAYWLASQAHRVYMGRTDAVGSIGVKTVLYDYSEAFKDRGVKAIPVTTGKYKTAGEMGTPVTQAHKDYFQGMVDAYFSEFESSVKRGRTFDAASFDDVSDGRVFIGSAGVENGLVDGIQSPGVTLGNMIAGRDSRDTAARGRTRTARARWKASRTGVEIGV